MLRLVDAGLDWRAVEGEVLALDLASSEYLGVNPTGTILWHELAAGAALETLVARLVAETGIDVARAASDVASFLAQLRARRLLIEEPGRAEA
jgi:hypothetical protein